MFILASYIAPRVAAKVAGKFSLYTSMFLVAFLILSSFALVLFIVFYYVGFEINLMNLIITILLLNVLIYLFSPILIKISFNAEEDKKLQKIVDEVKNKLKYKSKITALKVSYLPNAFAFGNFIFGKYVAVSDSLMNMLNEEELKAVIAHEIGHHMHRDNAIILIFGLIPSIIYYIGYTLFYSSLRRSEEKKGSALIIGLVLMFFSFVVQILVLAFSRLREYFADYEGVKGSSKIAMQSSLGKLHKYYKGEVKFAEEFSSKKNVYKTLFIYAFIEAATNPFLSLKEIERIKNEKYSYIEEFLSTHPPIPKRLKFLDSISL